MRQIVAMVGLGLVAVGGMYALGILLFARKESDMRNEVGVITVFLLFGTALVLLSYFISRNI